VRERTEDSLRRDETRKTDAVDEVVVAADAAVVTTPSCCHAALA